MTEPPPATAQAPRDETARARVAAICALAALGPLSTNIFLPSLSAIATDLGVSSADMTASISTFLAVFAVGQLAVGPLSDRFGRRGPVLLGLGVFVLGTVWCALAADLAGLLVGRSIQACGACAATVLARAIATDLFAGPALARVMAAIMIAATAAPGLSPLLGSGLAEAFGWRSAFVFVAGFAACTLLGCAIVTPEARRTAADAASLAHIARAYFTLLRNPRFLAPTRAAALTTAALFAVFSAAPSVLIGQFGLSPIALGLVFAGVVGLVFGAAALSPGLSARFGLHRAILIGLAVAAVGGGGLLIAVQVAGHAFAPFLLTVTVFLVGVGVASPLAGTAALSPFPEQAGVASALFGFVQMAGAACGAWLAATIATDATLGLAMVLAVASPLALTLFWRDGLRAR